jgi:P-type Ca2+ transporter type 2C
MKQESAPTSSAWYSLSLPDVLARLHVDASQGLILTETETRRQRYGPNQITERGAKGPLQIILRQLTGLLVIILIIAAIISTLLGDLKDAIAILAIVVLNAILGFVQEYRAEQAMAALKKLAVPAVRVRREGEVREIPAPGLVPGDIVLLEAGNLVPADGRLLESANLRIQEAILTGESEPIQKIIEPVSGADLPLGDQRNMAFMGTTVTYGRGLMVVTDIGMSTQLGRVADMIQGVESSTTPLQRRLDQLGRGLALAALLLVVVIFGLGLLRGEDLDLMIMTSISMAVAIVPEGLPAVVTITLALGAQRMLKRRALIRKLPAVETLGSVTVICSDKTGTLTENRMTVTVLDLAGHRVDLVETYQHREPVVLPEEPQPDNCEEPPLNLLLTAGALCNDATLRPDPSRPGYYHALGDPTEGALVVAAARFGLWKTTLEQAFVRVSELPFDSERRRMTTVHSVDRSTNKPGSRSASEYVLSTCLSGHLSTPFVAFVKGSPDGLIDISRSVWATDHAEPLDAAWRARIAAANEQLAGQGMRVLGFAFKPVEQKPDDSLDYWIGASTTLPTPAPAEVTQEELERDLIFIGLVGMIDPPRAEVKAAVTECKTAGIRPVMITGDHPLTARQIARELGITNDNRILTGQDVGRMSAQDLERVVEDVSVYARVSPEHKLNIVEALQKRGHVVAMTGDGVNDAPALKRADIGVAMGITGTDVSKEAASMVLLDDNFTTIVSAVEEGRGIYDNIRKFVKFSLAGNLGKVLIVLVAPLLGLPLPLNPFQVLYMNLVTDGILGLGMSVEPAERGVMRRPPHRPNESIFSRGLGTQILWIGALISLIGLGVGLLAAFRGMYEINWDTLILTTIIFSQVFQALAIRSNRDSLFRIGLFSNKPLLAAASLIVGLQLVIVYAPSLRGLFSVAPLSAGELALAVGASSLVLWAIELEKWLARRRERSNRTPDRIV